MKPTVPALLISLALSACAAGAPDTVATSATSAPPAAPAVAQAPAPAPAPTTPPAVAPAADLAAGKSAFEQGCFACHDQATILSQGGRTKADWQDVVSMMQDRGFSGSPDEIKAIIEYLAATYPPKAG